MSSVAPQVLFSAGDALTPQGAAYLGLKPAGSEESSAIPHPPKSATRSK